MVDKRTIAILAVAAILVSILIFATVTLFQNNSGSAGYSISFTCDATSTAYPITYTINWGDGTATTGSANSESFTTSHVYSSSASYLAVCSATDSLGDFLGDGSTQVNIGTTSSIQYTAPSTTSTQSSQSSATTSASQTTTVTVTQSAFSVSATPYPGSGTVPLAVEFGTSSAPGSSYTCTWTFGDGSSGNGCNVQHIYTVAGTYTAEVTATSTQTGQVATSSATVVVSPPPLSISISASPSSGNAPLATTLASTVSGGTAPYTYSWTLGDGSTSSTADPSHTYQNAGTYLAQLTVTDSNGAKGTSSYTVNVNSLTSSTSSYVTTVVTTTETSLYTTEQTSVFVSGSSTMTTTKTLTGTSTITTSECLYLSELQCHLPNTPPGLPIAWATSNITVDASSVNSQISVTPNVFVRNIQASNTISNVAFSQTYNAMQIEFSGSGPVSLSLQIPSQPSSVWADSNQITTWSYANGVLTVSADPSTITVFFGSASSSSLTAFLEANWILIVIVVVIAAGIVGASIRKR